MQDVDTRDYEVNPQLQSLIALDTAELFSVLAAKSNPTDLEVALMYRIEDLEIRLEDAECKTDEMVKLNTVPA